MLEIFMLYFLYDKVVVGLIFGFFMISLFIFFRNDYFEVVGF